MIVASRRYVPVLLFVLCAGFAHAQLAAVLTRDLSDVQQPTLAALLTRRVNAELDSRGYTRYDLGDRAHGAGDPSEPRITTVDIGQVPDDLDVVVAALYRVESDAVVVQFVLTDPVANIVVGGVLSRQRAGLTISTSVEAALEDLRPSLDRWERDRERLRLGMPTDKVERIFVYGPQEGVSARFAALEIGSVRGGRIFVPYSPFPVGTTVPITLSKRGYHDRTVDVVLAERRVELTLPSLTPAGRFGVSVLSTSSFLSGGGVGMRFYPVADRFYVSLEHYRSYQPQPAIRPVRTYRNRLAGGLSPFEPGLLVRPFVEAGAGVMLTDLGTLAPFSFEDDPLYVDVYVGVSVGGEVTLGRWRPFIRADVDYSLGVTRTNTLGPRWIGPPLTSLPIPIPMATVGVTRTW